MIEHENVLPAVEPAPARSVATEAAVAAGPGAVAAGDDGFGLCSAEPIPSWHLVDCHRPYLQKPLESYRVGYPHSVNLSAFHAQSFVVLNVMILALSSLPPVFACLLLL
jgi:hypothetical protein